MTYCLGIKVKDGMLCLADGRITSGNQVSSARKVSLFSTDERQVCIMTSGLRSLRDKAVAYFEEACEDEKNAHPERMLDLISLYTRCLRKVMDEDKEYLNSSGLYFDLHTIVAGQMKRDQAPKMYLIYPEGNWIEVNERAPHISIGSTSYGKPVLDRVITWETPLSTVLKAAYIAFDSTRVSAVDVGYPVDILTYASDQVWREQQFEFDDLLSLRKWWNEQITRQIASMSDEPWAETLLP
ncbi:MAG: hypothetical protein JKX94_03605 [Sneathiella sp.]|nr:hypothetical protein [Sneathiella sp.]